MHTVKIRGNVPHVLSDIFARCLPAVGERVAIELESNGHLCGFAPVIRVDPAASTYAVDTERMTHPVRLADV